jgi:hypothetical protein
MSDIVEFEAFRMSWLESVQADSPNTVELGRRFALKLVSQWIDASEATADFVYCDGSGDGGIDVAVLDVGMDASSDAPEESGDAWYLVQSKYGSAFAGSGTLMAEGQKVIETLDGRRLRLNSLAEGLLERLSNFRNAAGPSDRLVLVFATERPLNQNERLALDDLRKIGRERLGPISDVEALSIETIHKRLQDEASAAARLSLPLVGNLVDAGNGLLVGSVPLVSLYEFLKRYRDITSDLDQIYEKNVRRFLGGRGKVNRGMQATLRDAPERFGLYNNGITLVVSDYAEADGAFQLTDPYVVNGCQTSRTIWEVFQRRYAAGGTGVDPEMEKWKQQAASAVVVVKVVKVGAAGEALLQAITRYTNSQNAVREKDFLALTSDFHTWQQQLSDRYGLYLEIQRGGWDSQKALQNSNPSTRQYSKTANAADLIKVFGAGWLNEAGNAFGKNPPFLPEGAIFKRIVNEVDEASGEPFGADDLYAAYLLQAGADELKFGRGAQTSRRQTRILFYMVAVDLLRDVLTRTGKSPSLRDLSAAMIKTFVDPQARGALLDQAVEVIDSYMTQSSDDSVFKEPAYSGTFNTDLNGFLKWEKFGRSELDTPRLRSALAMAKSLMGRGSPGSTAPTPRALIQHAAA